VRRSHPLSVGLALGGPADPRAWREALVLAGWADASGLHSLWLPEGHLRRGAPSAPLLGLAALGAVTTRIRLGTTSLLISIHDPLRVALEVALLDQLTGGRVVLGLGRGFEASMLHAFGVDPRAKRDRFDEALDAILARWNGTDGATLRPLQEPHPPLFVAAFGAKGLLQAARRGLPYLASPLESLAVLERNFAEHAAALPAEVERGALPVAVMRTVHVAAGRAEAARARADAEAEFAALASRASGALAERAAGLASERVIVGEPTEVAEEIGRYRERLGMDLLVVRPAARVADGEQLASLERLVERVLPSIGGDGG
jgi:alkanesulfonate monooxygenase SsuD/methylene tetrahydromethanopterin reductase-like flavin-dependent oxidoreductase (luciferase family)